MGVFESHSFVEHEQVVFCHDKPSGLRAIIAIHDTTLGPALGGCRFWNYGSESDAIRDVLRLSRGMTYKAAITGLNLGGGKAVIMGDPKKLRSEGLFRAFGRFIDSLGGRYITAEDVNMSVEDMEHVAAETPYVTGVRRGSGDPSPVTALGVFHGIRAAAKYKLGREDLKGMKVAVQGVGHVGMYLCQYLHEAGAKLIVTDIDQARIQDVVKRFGAAFVGETEIHSQDVDVYAPCALGAILNDETIPQIKAPIIAGAANNQLQDENSHGAQLRERDILYAPDYVINAGGLINVYHELQGYHEEAAHAQAKSIYNTLLAIFKQSDNEGIATQQASNQLAERRLANTGGIKDLRNTLDNQVWAQS